jgi:hypothetical protein
MPDFQHNTHAIGGSFKESKQRTQVRLMMKVLHIAFHSERAAGVGARPFSQTVTRERVLRSFPIAISTFSHTKGCMGIRREGVALFSAVQVPC